MKLRTERRVHQDGVVQLCRGLGDVDCLHLLEASQWVTLRYQLRYGALVQSARDQQDDIIDHVAVPEVSQERDDYKTEKSVLYICLVWSGRGITLRPAFTPFPSLSVKNDHTAPTVRFSPVIVHTRLFITAMFRLLFINYPQSIMF